MARQAGAFVTDTGILEMNETMTAQAGIAALSEMNETVSAAPAAAGTPFGIRTRRVVPYYYSRQ